MQLSVRDLIALVLVVGFVAGVGVTMPAAHERASLPADLELVDAGCERVVGDRPPAIYTLTLQITYTGSTPVTAGVWTWYESRHSYGYWPSNTSRDRGHVHLTPGETTTITARATHPENAVIPGVRVSIILMSLDGTQRTAITRRMPGTRLSLRNTTGPITPEPC